MPRIQSFGIALVWTQFTAYHVDRCKALADRMAGSTGVLAIEVAGTSNDYADFPAADSGKEFTRATIFPGVSFEAVSPWRRFLQVGWRLRRCRMVCIGVPYSCIEFVILAWILRICGKTVVLMCDSKFDDRRRNATFEFVKKLGLAGFAFAIYASLRTEQYLSFLGFKADRLYAGYDGVSVERIASDAREYGSMGGSFEERPFVYVGRLVEKKNLPAIINAYAAYLKLVPGNKRNLVIVGSGPLEGELKALVRDLGLSDRVVFAGFLSGPPLAAMVARSIGLLLLSSEEQWGLVVNEAAALGIPVILSESPGARDILVRNLISGYVIELGSISGAAQAMYLLGEDEARWKAMSAAILETSSLGDVSWFAQSVEAIYQKSGRTS